MLNGLLLSIVMACGEKAAEVETAKPVETPVETVAETVPEPVEEVAPEPEPEPKPEPNVDFNTTITFSDGTAKTGHVIRVERSSDFYGMKEWLDTESIDHLCRVRFYSQRSDVDGTKVCSVAPKKGDIIMYESEWNPWLYVCTNKTTSSLVDAEGRSGIGQQTQMAYLTMKVLFSDPIFRTLEQDSVEELGGRL